MTRRIVSISLLLAACGGTADESFDTAAMDRGIVNGSVDTGHPSVGRVRFDGADICTGTLVGAKTVLTAAHCIPGGASRYAFVVGGRVYAAASAGRHSSYDPDGDDGEGSADLGLLRLRSAPSVAPSPVAATAPRAGQRITLVGFGVTGEEQDDFGTKRVTTNTIGRVTSTKFYFTPGSGTGTTCYGDSGGPAFSTVGGVEFEVGVTSGGIWPCEEGLSWDTRVDAFLPWLRTASGGDLATGGPPPDTAAPVVRITSPAAGARTTTSVTVKATLTDNVGAVRAELAVDGKTVAVDGAAPWSLSARVSRGTHVLRVTGYDAAGNRGEASVRITAR